MTITTKSCCQRRLRFKGDIILSIQSLAGFSRGHLWTLNEISDKKSWNCSRHWKSLFSSWVLTKKRDVTWFLWLKDIKNPPTPDNILTYRFTRIPFGVILSPFSLGATIKHHLEKKMSRILHKIYVDNFITDLEFVEELSQLYTICKEKFKKILLNLWEWKSSSTKLNKVFK